MTGTYSGQFVMEVKKIIIINQIKLLLWNSNHLLQWIDTSGVLEFALGSLEESIAYAYDRHRTNSFLGHLR